MVTMAQTPRALAQALQRAQRAGVDTDDAMTNIMVGAAQEEEEQRISDQNRAEFERLRKYGFFKYEDFLQLERDDPETFNMLVAATGDDLAKATETDLSVLVPEQASAEGKAWFQRWIAPEHRALWTAAYPPIDEDGFQPPARDVSRHHFLHKIAEGWSRRPKAPFKEKGALKCRMKGPQGRTCIYEGGYDEAQRLDHEMHRHPDQFRARLIAQEYESREANLAQQAAMLEQQKALVAAVQGGGMVSGTNQMMMALMMAMAEKLGFDLSSFMGTGDVSPVEEAVPVTQTAEPHQNTTPPANAPNAPPKRKAAAQKTEPAPAFGMPPKLSEETLAAMQATTPVEGSQDPVTE